MLFFIDLQIIVLALTAVYDYYHRVNFKCSICGREWKINTTRQLGWGWILFCLAGIAENLIDGDTVVWPIELFFALPGIYYAWCKSWYFCFDCMKYITVDEKTILPD